MLDYTENVEKMPTKNRALMTDAMVDGLAVGAIVWDTRVPGLYIRRGKTRVTWTYLAERRRHGRRLTVCKRLGHYPNLSTAAARKAALVEAGKIAGGVTTAPLYALRRHHLLGLAKRRGKPPRWHKNATYWAKTPDPSVLGQMVTRGDECISSRCPRLAP
jgi:hypothetical protein